MRETDTRKESQKVQDMYQNGKSMRLRRGPGVDDARFSATGNVAN
jgi:hypothetical protein